MIAEVEQALRVQDLDLRIRALTSEIAELPKQIAEIERQLDAHRQKLERDRATLAANGKERKQLDGDIAGHQQKISKLRDQMLQAKTNEQYRAFQHEIEFCETKIREAEDRILELMTAGEALDANVKAAESALAAEQKDVEAQKAKAREQTDLDKKALAEAQQQRTAIFQGLPKPVQMQYDRLKKKHANGVVVAEAVDGVCRGCRLQLRPQFYQDLRRAAELMYCESCGRIVYYNAPIDQQAQFEGGTRVSLS